MSDLTISQLNSQNKHFGRVNQNVFDKSVIYAADRVHAVPPKGKLVHSSLLSAPKIFVKDTAEDVASLGKAIKSGDSNDYKLGRINDLALKIGSLAIAGYLFTKKSAPKQKMMEFIGFASFFASMALWPKLFIQTPAKLIHGIDVFQEYEDSQGRKKKFFQDPQYIPWDIISDKQMEKLGDRLNIPKDVPNRSDLTKEKAHKIALQSNTMWMLSAGFGVPIMSAFICSGVEKLLPKIIDNKRLNASNSQLTNLQNLSIESIKPIKEQVKIFDAFRKNITDKTVVDDAFLKNLAKAVTPNPDYSKHVYEALSASVGQEKISQEGIDALFEKHSANLKHWGIDRAKFDENFARYAGQPIEVQKRGLILALKESGTPQAKYQNFEFATNFITKKGIVREGISNEVLEQAKGWNLLFAKMDAATRVIENNLSLNSANSADALATKHWNSFNNALVKVLGLNSKEIDIVRNSRSEANRIIAEKLSGIAKDETSYKKQFGSLMGLYDDFAKDFDLEIVSKNGFNVSGPVSMISGLKEHKSKISKIYSNFADAFQKAGLSDFASRIFIDADNNPISKANSTIYTKIDIPLQSKFSAFSRNLLTMDFFKRKADGTLGEQIKKLAGLRLNAPVSDEFVASITKSSENLLFNGEIGDFLSKMSTNGNGNLEYKVVMDLLFDKENLSPVTKELISKGQKDGQLFTVFLSIVLDVVGGLFNRHYRHMAIDGMSHKYQENSNILLKPSLYHSLWGDSMSSMIGKTADNITNTSIWNKKFARLGIGVAAVTVLSQFFFGHLNLGKNSSKKESEAA